VGNKGLRPKPARREQARVPGDRCSRGPSPPSGRQSTRRGPWRSKVSWDRTRLRVHNGEKTLRSHLVTLSKSGEAPCILADTPARREPATTIVTFFVVRLAQWPRVDDLDNVPASFVT
jgi:hypothetical protein